jgi:hypothetical protein
MSKGLADARLSLEDFCVPLYCYFAGCHTFDCGTKLSLRNLELDLAIGQETHPCVSQTAGHSVGRTPSSTFRLRRIAVALPIVYPSASRTYLLTLTASASRIRSCSVHNHARFRAIRAKLSAQPLAWMALPATFRRQPPRHVCCSLSWIKLNSFRVARKSADVFTVTARLFIRYQLTGEKT